MSQFFGQQLLAAQYFRPQYLHGAATQQDSRSGYWRLFYYQLQEAELEKEKLRNEQKQGQKAPEGKSEVPSQAAPTVSKKPRTVAKPRPAVTPPNVHPRPMYRELPKQFDSAPWLSTLNTEFKAWNLAAQTLHGVLEQQKAANDEEEETLTLLLLAA